MSDPAVESLTRFLARFSAGDTAAVRDAIAPAFFTYIPVADEPTATDIFEQFLTEFRTAAPDLAIEIPDLHRSEGGLLEGTAEVTGTRSGPLWGVPPTGRSHRFEIPVTVREIDGRYALNITLAVPQVLTIFRDLELVNPPDQMHLPPRHPTTMPDFIIKVLFDGQVADKPCQHVDEA
ncbi:MAG: ester cyclase, partial [Chloroflexota bacterium]